MTYLFFDTETVGLPANYDAPASDTNNWPRMIQLGYQLCNSKGLVLQQNTHIIKPDGFEIPSLASQIHGITTEIAMKEGVSLRSVLNEFFEVMHRIENCVLVAHNFKFDFGILGAEFWRSNGHNPLEKLEGICTMTTTTKFVAIKNYYGYKWPNLQELHQACFGTGFEKAHDAGADVAATVRCFFELKRRGIL